MYLLKQGLNEAKSALKGVDHKDYVNTDLFVKPVCGSGCTMYGVRGCEVDSGMIGNINHAV